MVFGECGYAISKEQEALLSILKERYVKYLTLIGRYEASWRQMLEKRQSDRAIDIVTSNLPLSVMKNIIGLWMI
jgi:hypothetical protein